MTFAFQPRRLNAPLSRTSGFDAASGDGRGGGLGATLSVILPSDPPRQLSGCGELCSTGAPCQCGEQCAAKRAAGLGFLPLPLALPLFAASIFSATGAKKIPIPNTTVSHWQCPNPTAAAKGFLYNPRSARPIPCKWASVSFPKGFPLPNGLYGPGVAGECPQGPASCPEIIPSYRITQDSIDEAWAKGLVALLDQGQPATAPAGASPAAVPAPVATSAVIGAPLVTSDAPAGGYGAPLVAVPAVINPATGQQLAPGESLMDAACSFLRSVPGLVFAQMLSSPQPLGAPVPAPAPGAAAAAGPVVSPAPPRTAAPSFGDVAREWSMLWRGGIQGVGINGVGILPIMSFAASAAAGGGGGGLLDFFSSLGAGIGQGITSILPGVGQAAMSQIAPLFSGGIQAAIERLGLKIPGATTSLPTLPPAPAPAPAPAAAQASTPAWLVPAAIVGAALLLGRGR